MEVISAIPQPKMVKVPGRPNRTIGKEEYVFPCGTVVLTYGVATGYPDNIALHLVEQVGREGVVKVELGETPENALRRAKQGRIKWIRGFLANFRRTNAQIKATGGIPNMPSDELYEMMAEFQRLQKDFGMDMLAKDFGINQPVEDTHGKELEQFGLPQESVPLVPGVPEGLSGIADL
jgi:hypothetical protein